MILKVRRQDEAAWPGPRRIVVHAGFRKTGSTSVQDWLSMNASALPSGFLASPRDDLTRPFRKAANDFVKHGNRRRLRRACEDLRNAVAGIDAEVLLISDENLIGRSMVSDDGRTIFALASEILREMERAFGAAPLEFVFYTRDKDRWLRSAWAQGVKRAGVAVDFPAWKADLPTFEWEGEIAKIRDALRSPVRVYAMEEDLAHSPAVVGRSLFVHAGLPDHLVDTLPRPGRSNASLPRSALAFLLQVNALNLPLAQRRSISRLVEDNVDLFASPQNARA